MLYFTWLGPCAVAVRKRFSCTNFAAVFKPCSPQFTLRTPRQSSGNGRYHRLKSFTQKILLSLVLLTAFAGISAHAQSAGSWNRRGQAAEAREDYDAAYNAYRQAHLKNPNDLRYKTHFERMKFQAGAQHVDRGRVLRQSGDLAGALTQFLRALEIDPTNQTAQQEADLVRQQAAPQPPAASETTPQQDATLKAIGSVSGPIELQPLSTDLITLHMVEDTKVIYQAIGKATGVNVLFDPEYTSKRIPIDLTSVTWQDALRIVGILSGTFWKPVTVNTIFVAQNTRTKRTDLDSLAVQTFYLTNASQQNDGNEVTTALRNLLDPSVKVYLIPGQNAIVMRATPDQLLLAEKLINDLDRAKPEVVVDVAVLEVSRDKIRNLGISLPNQFGLTLVSPTASSTSTTSTGSTSTTTPTTSQLTLNQLGHINATNFAVTINAATVNALLSDSDTRVLQNPRIRATDGQRATLKIGSKIPVATGSYNAGAATGIGAGLGVQTQFTYLDVGVNIDMTPTVHYDREISLKLKIEVSSHTGDQTISGVTEPIISQRVIDQVIQLKEGEPSILAGILQKQDTRNSSGTPGLGEIPLLKYFFGSQFKEQQTDEVVFLLIPHIVRESVLTRLNTRAIDTGTGQSIELRHDADVAPAIVPAPAARNPQTPVTATRPAPNADIANMSPGLPASSPNSPPVTAANAVNAAAAQMADAQNAQAPIAISVMPPVGTQAVGSTFQLAITVANAHDLYSVPLQLQFNPNVLSLVNVDSGDFLGRDGQAVAVVHRDEGGSVTISASRPPNVNGISGAGTLCTLTFKALAAGDTPVAFVRVGAKNSAQVNLPAAGTQAVVHVK